MSDHDTDTDFDDGHSPRKRRRVGSVSHPQRDAREHKQLRLRHEANYRDEYRTLFNDYVTETVSRTRSDGDDYMTHSGRQLGSSRWSFKEKKALFTALDRLGRHDLPGIAATVTTKTQPEVRAFLTLLHDAAARNGHVTVNFRHIPAAVDIDGTCAEKLDDAADALAWYQETLEAAQEKNRHGDYWLITPDIAANIEGTFRGEDEFSADRDSVDRRVPQPPSSGRPLSKSGQGITGACLFCKARKKKCDRRFPCAYCVKSDVQCVYPNHAPAPAGNSHPDQKALPLAVPEAALLQPETMLKLSRDIFMNRSPEFPSPWLHWSQYTSELASEPSMYRTAFNDFHTLVVSLTRRLVQTTLAQASSRLRAQRHRNTKRAKPMITLRDAYSAIDVLGLARNGHERWRGAPRRCGLQVFTHRYAPKKGKVKHDLSWSSVEQALSYTPASDEAQASQSDASIPPDDYKSRMARSGTPLPMHNLTLSDPETDTEHTDMSEDDNSDLLEQSENGDLHTSVEGCPLSQESVGRSSSGASDSARHEISPQSATIQELDHATSKEEEQMLCRLLGIRAASNVTPTNAEDQEDLKLSMNENVITAPEDWERYFDYQMPWERYTTPVPKARLLANQKPASPMPSFPGTATHSPESDLGNASHMSSTERLASRRYEGTTEKELQARGTNAYAAWRREDFGESGEEIQSSSESESGPMEDVVAQSVESGHDSAD